MAATYRDRNATYGNNCTKVGQILAILYPDGMQLKTADDFTRWHLVDWMVGKLTRFSCGNHLDSIHDLAVYAAMVEGWLKHEKRSNELLSEEDKGKIRGDLECLVKGFGRL
jgi:hypothetical protein